MNKETVEKIKKQLHSPIVAAIVLIIIAVAAGALLFTVALPILGEIMPEPRLGTQKEDWTVMNHDQNYFPQAYVKKNNREMHGFIKISNLDPQGNYRLIDRTSFSPEQIETDLTGLTSYEYEFNLLHDYDYVSRYISLQQWNVTAYNYFAIGTIEFLIDNPNPSSYQTPGFVIVVGIISLIIYRKRAKQK